MRNKQELVDQLKTIRIDLVLENIAAEKQKRDERIQFWKNLSSNAKTASLLATVAVA